MRKLILVRPSIDYHEVPSSLGKFFPPPTGNYYKEPPMGILYVAASCLKAGIKTKIIDQYLKNLSNEEVLRIVTKEKPDYVGFSLTSFTLKNSKLLAEKIKTKNNKCKILVGGPWVTIEKEKIMRNNEFDFAVYGEGEKTTPDLIKNINSYKNLSKIDGLIFRNKQKVIVNKPRGLISNLDSIPYPAFSLVNMNDYSRGKSIYVDSKPVDYICATRGCPYACAFCSSKYVWGRRYRTRNPKKVADEMAYMMKKYKSKGFHFRDDNLTVNRKYILNLCQELIKRKISAKWMCESRIDTIDEEMVKSMKEAGCTGIWFGIESGSQKILNYLNKGITLAAIKKTIKICQKYELKVGGSFMVGVPIETKETLRQTVQLAKKLNLDNTFFNLFIGIPKCEIYDEITKKKLYKHEFNGNLIVETPRFSSNELYNLNRRINFYFELKRLRLILSTHPVGEYPSLFFYVLKSLWSLFIPIKS